MRLLDREACTARLRGIFPPEVVEDHSAVAGPIAGAAVYVGIYVGALEGHNPIRPSMVLWMCDGVAAHARPASPERFERDRDQWYRAARRSHRALIKLLDRWGITHQPWYADNSREPLRDETFREWLRLGAMAHDPALPTTSPLPAWTLRGEFAALFKPQLRGRELQDATREWQVANLGTVGRARIRLESARRAAAHAVDVRLPSGAVRPLAPGDSSLILGEIHEARKKELLRWADDHGIRPDQCGFLTGFLSRTHEAFRRRVSRIAWSTYAWFLDEPDQIVRLEDLPERDAQ